MTRLQFRLLETLLLPTVFCIGDGFIHYLLGEAPINQFMIGAMAAVFILRCMDVLRAYLREWPEI